MSLTNWPDMQGKEETETTRMTSSTITSNFTLESQEVYEEEFTLMTKPPSHHNKRLESCLAWKIAEKYPAGIKEETLKMIEYYETSLHSQIKDYHKLVEENARVKKQNQRLTSMNLEYEMKRSARQQPKERDHEKEHEKKEKKDKNQEKEKKEEKENRMALAARRIPNCNIPKTPEKGLNNERIEQLQDRVISRDRKINQLNNEVSELTLKLRKYRRRFESTGIRQ